MVYQIYNYKQKNWSTYSLPCGWSWMKWVHLKLMILHIKMQVTYG